MARYNLPQPMSMYRDTGLVDISKEFRNRYVQNMAADNALSKAILEMASMEEDQEKKRMLMEKYNAQLHQRSESGNYHMLGNAVVKDAQSFMRDYQPIQQNKQQWDAWLKGLTDSRDAFIKTGKGVDPFTYNAKIAEAKYNYNGFEYNADGSVDESTMFKGPSYVGYVDVESKIIKHMKDVVMTEIDTTGMEYALGIDGKEIQIEKGEKGDPAYYMTYGSYRKQLSPELVSKVVRSVLNQPDTQAYTQQTAYLENFTKDRINPETNLSLAAEEVDNILSILDTEITKLESAKPKNRQEKEEIEDTLKYKERVEEYILEARDKGIDEVTILTNLSAETKELAYIDAAISKYAGVKSRKEVRKYSESSRYTQGLKGGGGTNTIKFRVGPNGMQVDVLGGTDVSSKQDSFNEADAVIKNYINSEI